MLIGKSKNTEFCKVGDLGDLGDLPILEKMTFFTKKNIIF
jgi:hypothetical protein